MARIAWIGAGKMGLPVCRRLKDAGHDVRVQFDVTKVQESQKAKDLDI